MAQQKKNATGIIVAGVWRGCFIHVFSPEEDLNGKLAYSLDVLIPKKKPGDLAKVKALYEKLCLQAFGKNTASHRPWSYKAKMKGDKAIIKDGDARYDNAAEDKKQTYEPYRDHYYMSLRLDPKDGRPVVTDRSNIPIADESELQSGDYVMVQIKFSAYSSKKWGDQVSMYLLGVRKIKTGERLTSALVNTEAALAGFESAEWDESEWLDDDDDGFEGADSEEDDIC